MPCESASSAPRQLGWISSPLCATQRQRAHLRTLRASVATVDLDCVLTAPPGNVVHISVFAASPRLEHIPSLCLRGSAATSHFYRVRCVSAAGGDQGSVLSAPLRLKLPLGSVFSAPLRQGIGVAFFGFAPPRLE